MDELSAWAWVLMACCSILLAYLAAAVLVGRQRRRWFGDEGRNNDGKSG